MKIALRSLFVVAAMLAMATPPQAQQGTPESDPTGEPTELDEGPELPRLIRVQVEFIEMAHEQLTELMFGEHTSANDGELRKKVAELVSQGKASILDTLLCTSKSGQKATTQSIEEYIYATEYEPAQASSEAPAPPASGDKPKPAARDTTFGPTPSAWETRNLGSTLEIEPSLSDNGKFVDLRFVPEIVYHVGDQLWSEWKDEHGRADIKMPTMYVLRINTSVVTAVGDYFMAAALSPKNAAGFPDFSRKVMIFVKSDVLTVGR